MLIAERRLERTSEGSHKEHITSERRDKGEQDRTNKKETKDITETWGTHKANDKARQDDDEETGSRSGERPRQEATGLDKGDMRAERTRQPEDLSDNERQARSAPLGTTPHYQPYHHPEEPHHTTTPVQVRAVRHARTKTTASPHTYNTNTNTTIAQRGVTPYNNAIAGARGTTPAH